MNQHGPYWPELRLSGFAQLRDGRRAEHRFIYLLSTSDSKFLFVLFMFIGLNEQILKAAVHRCALGTLIGGHGAVRFGALKSAIGTAAARA